MAVMTVVSSVSVGVSGVLVAKRTSVPVAGVASLAVARVAVSIAISAVIGRSDGHQGGEQDQLEHKVLC